MGTNDFDKPIRRKKSHSFTLMVEAADSSETLVTISKQHGITSQKTVSSIYEYSASLNVTTNKPLELGM
jgi:hypothetical protein